jgi:hypothetical protein
MTKPNPTVVAVVANLFFATHLATVAKSIGVTLEVVRPDQAPERCHEARPALVLVDLEAAPDIATVIARVKTGIAADGGRLVGIYPHVRDDLRQAGIGAGLDQAIPRSAVQRLLPGLLRSASATMS